MKNLVCTSSDQLFFLFCMSVQIDLVFHGVKKELRLLCEIKSEVVLRVSRPYLRLESTNR
jgi:hypothetical protein